MQVETTSPEVRIAGGWFAMGKKFCERQSKNPSNYKWQRLAFYCYANMKPGGRCELGPGLLQDFMESSKGNVGKMIRRAVDEGWLAEGSGERCLIAPTYDVQFWKSSRE